MNTRLFAAEIHDFQENFKRRGESFKEGMFLLVCALKNNELKKLEDNEKPSQFINNYADIVHCIDDFYEEYASKLKSATTLEMGKTNLNDLLYKYKQLLQANVSLKDPFQALCIAERYSVWQKGREPLSTTIKNCGLKITQQEIPLQDTEILAKEYEKINNKTPPFCFQRLAPWEQEVIQAYLILFTKNPIPSSLRSVPGPANLSKHVCTVNDDKLVAYFRYATPRPVDLMHNKDAYNEEYRITCMNMASQIRLSLEDQCKQTDNKPIKEAVILTQSLLSPGTFADLKSKISGPSDNDTKIYKMKEEVVELFQYALSHPNKPLNEKHALLKALFFSETQVNQPIYYKDFLSLWGLKAQPEGLVKYQNCDPIKITLLSTNHPLNILRRGGVYQKQTTRNEHNTALLLGVIARYLRQSTRHREHKLRSQRAHDRQVLRGEAGNALRRQVIAKAAAHSLECSSPWQTSKPWFHISHEEGALLVEPNSPSVDLNKRHRHYSRLVKKRNPSIQDKLLVKLFRCESKGSISKQDKQNIIKILDSFLKQAHKDESTNLLFYALKLLLSTPPTQGSFLEEDTRHKQLMISSAEAIILNCIKGSLWVACKSGKDRTGIASVAYDATLLYYKLYKKLPGYQDEKPDREAYISQIKKLFYSGHQQTLAGQNAPGAKGIVEPKMILPADVKLHDDSNRLNTFFARLNKPSDPGKTQMLGSSLAWIQSLKPRFFNSLKNLASQASKMQEDQVQLAGQEKTSFFRSY